MNKIDLSIITVSYKSEKSILPFLNSLKKSKDSLNKETIVIDNYPNDNTATLAEKHSVKPIVIRNTENVGFAKAINKGLKIAKGKYVLIINTDTKIVGDALKKLYLFAETKNKLGAVAPRLLDNLGKVQPSCFKFPTIFNALKQNFFGCKNCYKKYNPGNGITKVEVAVMAAFLVPKTTIDEVGGLDERFFLYYEDIEFCQRLWHHNLPVYYYPLAKVKHEHGASGNFADHLHSPLLASAKIYYGNLYFQLLNIVLWVGHKWQVILKGKRFRD